MDIRVTRGIEQYSDEKFQSCCVHSGTIRDVEGFDYFSPVDRARLHEDEGNSKHF
jgi:hypothetical protein